MDLKQIRYFIAVAEAGSFTAGSRRAFVTQSTLSTAIADLELELGCKLFERRARGVSLTARGDEVLRRARQILRLSEELRATARTDGATKPLRIGVIRTLPAAMVAGEMARLKTLAPEREMRMETAAAEQIMKRFASGRYDAVLSMLDMSEPGIGERVVLTDRLALAFASTDVPDGPVTPAVLHRQPLIVRTHCEMLQAASRILDRSGVKPTVVLRTGSDELALQMVRQGVGSCLMPDSFHCDGVTFRRPEGVDMQRRIGFRWTSSEFDGLFSA